LSDERHAEHSLVVINKWKGPSASNQFRNGASGPVGLKCVVFPTDRFTSRNPLAAVCTLGESSFLTVEAPTCYDVTANW